MFTVSITVAAIAWAWAWWVSRNSIASTTSPLEATLVVSGHGEQI